MMQSPTVRGCLAALATLCALPAVGDNRVVPSSTPAGIMLVEILRELSTSSDQYLGTRLGDAGGRTLFYSDDGRNCASACAEEFPPVLAPADMEPFDDWSLVRRTDGSMQWAYQSRPLHTWTRESEPGEVAVNVAIAEEVDLKYGESSGIENGSLRPPDGWRIARFDPGASISRPDGIDIVSVDSAGAVVLTNHSGFTLYTTDGYTDAAAQWTPLAAAALAQDEGDFSIVARADGTRQWAWMGRPLYRYDGDLLPGDAHGRAVDRRFRVAELQTNFSPPGVAVATLPGYGDLLTLDGMTLYAGSAFEKYWGGRNLRGSFRVAYIKGKRLGGNACVDDDCLRNWRPFFAPRDSKSNGFWEVIARDDGTKQWAYKGFALYTHVNDASPGEIRGHSTYDFVTIGDSAEDVDRATMLAIVGNAPGGAGVYWSIAKP